MYLRYYFLIFGLIMSPMEGSDDQVVVDYYSEDYYTEVDVQNTSTFLNTMLDNQPLKDDQVTDEVMDNLPLFPDDDDYDDYGISGYVKPNIGGDSSFSNIRDVSTKSQITFCNAKYIFF